jgi:hypothetical protein
MLTTETVIRHGGKYFMLIINEFEEKQKKNDANGKNIEKF